MLRYQQQTDAGQPAKSLLSPKAVLNLKPNLQNIADDAKAHTELSSVSISTQMSSSTSKQVTDALIFTFFAK
jgi:Fe-S cluster assembly protein SufD